MKEDLRTILLCIVVTALVCVGALKACKTIEATRIEQKTGEEQSE